MRITFAPLPPSEPRKRRSASQLKLGVAARSSMMRQRQLVPVNVNNTDQEGPRVQEQTQRKGQKGHRPAGSERWQDQAFSKAKGRGDRPREPDDPFLAMGRLMKSAWRRVSSPQTSPRGRPALGDDGDRLEQCDAPEDGPSEEEPEAAREQRYSHINSQTDYVVEEEDSDAFDDGNTTSTIKLKIPKTQL